MPGSERERCAACGIGSIGRFVCRTESHGIFMCDRCEAAWFEPEIVGPPADIGPGAVSPCPRCDGDRWTLEEFVTAHEPATPDAIWKGWARPHGDERTDPLFANRDDFERAHSPRNGVTILVRGGLAFPCPACDTKGYRWYLGNEEALRRARAGPQSVAGSDDDFIACFLDPNPWTQVDFERAHWPPYVPAVEPLFKDYQEFRQAHSGPNGQHIACPPCDAKGHRWTFGVDDAQPHWDSHSRGKAIRIPGNAGAAGVALTFQGEARLRYTTELTACYLEVGRPTFFAEARSGDCVVIVGTVEALPEPAGTGYPRQRVGLFRADGSRIASFDPTHHPVSDVAIHPSRPIAAIAYGSNAGGLYFVGGLHIWNWETTPRHSFR